MVQHSANGEISLYISYKIKNGQKRFSDDFYIQFIPNFVLESEKVREFENVVLFFYEKFRSTILTPKHDVIIPLYRTNGQNMISYEIWTIWPKLCKWGMFRMVNIYKGSNFRYLKYFDIPASYTVQPICKITFYQSVCTENAR